MACTRFNQTIATSCRNSQPGIKNVYLCNYEDITSYATDVAGDVVSGITITGETKCFYKLALNKTVGVVADAGSISIPNGTAVCKPSITFKIQGFSAAVRKIYEQLLQASVIVCFETMDGKFYLMGLENGMDAIELSYGSEGDPTGFKGLSVKLEGLEPVPFYENTITDFVSTHVN